MGSMTKQYDIRIYGGYFYRLIGILWYIRRGSYLMGILNGDTGRGYDEDIVGKFNADV
jgi:hypothetical protein